MIDQHLLYDSQQHRTMKKDNQVKKKLSVLLVAALITSHPDAISTPLYIFDQLLDEQGQPIQEWIANNQAFSIQLKRDFENNQNSQQSILFSQPSANNKFQVLLGDSDISSLFEYIDKRLVFKGGLPLPAGENNISVLQFVEQQWVPVGESTIKILSSAGFKQAKWTPRLELNINSQLDEKVSGDAQQSDKPTYTELTANLGLTSHHQSDDLAIESNVNLFAVSNREQAIQFGSRGNQAKKLDVADYTVNIIKGNHQIVVGHTSYGNNALVIDNLSRRGISWQYQDENELTFNGAILSGNDIVGYNNILGLSNYSEQFVNSLGFGLKLFAGSRISVRLEGNYLDAEKLSENDFGISEVTSSEQNQAMGMRLLISDSEGRLDADLVFGISRYTNPDDPELTLGDQLVELSEESAIAHNINMSYLLIQDWQSPWGSNINLTLTANHSSAEPLYQTLTAFVQANLKNKMAGARFKIGNISGNFGIQSSRDNLDNVVNLLTTKTELDSFSMSAPLAAIFAADTEQISTESWLPNLDYSFQQTHQFAISSPDFINSGFNDDSHLPDQLTTNHDIAISWQFETLSLAFQSSHNNQDNRQIGRESSDFSNLQHASNLSWQQNDSVAWVFSLAKNRQRDMENSKTEYTDSVSISYNWQSNDGLGLAISYGLNKEDDSLDESQSFSNTADISLVKNLIEGEWWLPVNGNISLRLNYNDSELIDNVFDQRSKLGTTTAQLGINLSF